MINNEILEIIKKYFPNENTEEGIEKFLNLKTKGDKQSLFHLVCMEEKNTAEMVKYLLEKKSNINEQNHRKNTALHSTVENEKNLNLEVIKFLIENKIEINKKEFSGLTALHKACSNDVINKEVITLLIESKSEIDSKDEFGKSNKIMKKFFCGFIFNSL
jgi:ankyrin repeat protein